MKLSTTCLLTVWVCALLTPCVMAAPAGSRSSPEDSDALEEASRMAYNLQTFIDSIDQSLALGDATADQDDADDTFARRRRYVSGLHSRYPSSGRRFRRPRVFVPRRRPNSRRGSRNNPSPY